MLFFIVVFCHFKKHSWCIFLSLGFPANQNGLKEATLCHLLLNDDFPQIELIQLRAGRKGYNSFPGKTAILYCLSGIVSAPAHAGDNALL